MPYVIAPESFIEVRIRYAMVNIEMMNVYHYRYAGPTQIPDGYQAAFQLGGHIANVAVSGAGRFAHYWQILAANVGITIYNVQTQWIHPLRYGVVNQEMAPVGGLVAQNVLPPPDQARIMFTTERAGKHFRGGLCIPGLTVLDYDVAGLWTAGAKTALGNLGNNVAGTIQIGAALTYGPWERIIFQRLAPTASMKVIGSVVMPQVRTQRRRVAGRGI
jgi:hypothetical protein